MNTAEVWMLQPKRFSPYAHLILMMITFVNCGTDKVNQSGVALLARKLASVYHQWHEVVLYVAATDPAAKPIIRPLPIARLPEVANLTHAHTLYVPPFRLDPSGFVLR